MIAITSTIKRLTSVLEHLAEQAAAIDQKNTANKAHKMVENNALFSVGLFVTDSDKFADYINEINVKISGLKRLIKANNTILTVAAVEKIEQQIHALIIALNANTTIHNDAKLRLDHKIKSIKARQYKKAVQAIVQNSQSLYQKLSEHHEFERRLVLMLNEQQQNLAKCHANKNQELSQQVLVLHQRLGRCRQAISLIERDIEFSEKR